ncbi:hypothetical protein PAMA_020833 [Pampus argenteus]
MSFYSTGFSHHYHTHSLLSDKYSMSALARIIKLNHTAQTHTHTQSHTKRSMFHSKDTWLTQGNCLGCSSVIGLQYMNHSRTELRKKHFLSSALTFHKLLGVLLMSLRRGEIQREGMQMSEGGKDTRLKKREICISCSSGGFIIEG